MALHEIYYNYGNEGALNNSPNTLLRLLKEKGYSSASIDDIKSFLSKQSSYTVHRRIRKSQFPRRHIRIPASKIRCDADLIELGDLAPWNKNFKYIFIIIDGFSKYINAVPIKRKEARQTADAFTQILDSGNLKSELLYTDSGKEFLGAPFQEVLRRNKIYHRLCTSGDFHCPFVERVIRTIKEKLFQAMTSQLTRTWIDLLPKIVSTYNSTNHSSTGMRPSEADKDQNTLKVFQHIKRKQAYPKTSKSIRYKFKKGDLVRILKGNSGGLISKGYLPRYTWEIFRIHQKANVKPLDRKPGIPPAYSIEDLKGEVIEHAVFYEPELSLVDPSILNNKFPIREILQEDSKRIKVWWHGAQKKDATWINRSQLSK